MNWRSIIGLVFLIGGVWRLYVLFTSNLGGTPIYGEVGCVIWMLVGVYLIIKGVTSNPE
jgi:hypothetical protein